MKIWAFVALVLSVCLGGQPVHAEVVQFHSAGRPPTPLQARMARERGVPPQTGPGDLISGELYRPQGTGPFPALVMLHTCRGRLASASEQKIATSFTALGFVVLAVDSFGPRGVGEQCVVATAVIDRIADAYGALDWLTGQSFVVPTRVALLGLSQGANVAFEIASSRDTMGRTDRATFAAAILYYPYCHPTDPPAKIPTLILIGDADDWTPARQCQAMAVQHAGAGTVEELIVYPGAQDGFNLVDLKGNALSLYGHRMVYEETADQAAQEAAASFLIKWMAH
ncbi:MAG: dienelactone hydrolase family protein [Acetobacteraceae bacterium]